MEWNWQIGMWIQANKTSAIVITLVEHLDHAQILWMHNVYNCPELAQFLKSKAMDCIGTLCTNRKNSIPS
jgi:hypothetical protein